MIHLAKLISGLLSVVVLLTSLAYAGGDLTAQEPIDVRVELGSADDALAFYPAKLEFETGKLYRLVLHNPSSQKHYFSSDKFSRAVFTRKVQVNDADGKATAEIKGSIREIEVYPKGTTEWWLVPVKTGELGDLVCTIAGHAEAGMKGSVSIK